MEKDNSNDWRYHLSCNKKMSIVSRAMTIWLGMILMAIGAIASLFGYFYTSLLVAFVPGGVILLGLVLRLKNEKKRAYDCSKGKCFKRKCFNCKYFILGTFNLCNKPIGSLREVLSAVCFLIPRIPEVKNRGGKCKDFIRGPNNVD